MAVAGFAFNEEIFPTQHNDFLLKRIKGSERHFHTYMILYIFIRKEKSARGTKLNLSNTSVTLKDKRVQFS